MSLDFLSGLLLTAVALAVVVFLIKETFAERIAGRKKPRQVLTDALDKVSGREAKPVNAHMIGAVGEVIAHSDDSSRPLTVRVGTERWPARGESTEDARLSIGAAVRVTAVDGPVLVVAATIDSTE